MTKIKIEKDKKDISDVLYIASMGAGSLDLIKKYGLGIELDHFCMAENMDGEKLFVTEKLVFSDLEKCGAQKKILHAPFNELFPAAIDPKARTLAMERYEQSYELAKKFGAKRMVVHSGYMPHVYFKSYHIERSVEFWSEFAKGKEDLTVLIENVLDDEPYMLRELIEKIETSIENGIEAGVEDDIENSIEDGIEAGEEASTEGGTLKKIHQKPKNYRVRFGVCLDIGHALCTSKVDISEWIRVLGKYIKHTHLHNNDGMGDFHAEFDCAGGKADMDEVFCALAKYGASDMTYTIECVEPEKSVEWLTKRGKLR